MCNVFVILQRLCQVSALLPARFILNGLVAEAVPDELAHLDALSKQLIQKAKAFQTVVRLGTITAKVPIYNSRKGTMSLTSEANIGNATGSAQIRCFCLTCQHQTVKAAQA